MALAMKVVTCSLMTTVSIQTCDSSPAFYGELFRGETSSSWSGPLAETPWKRFLERAARPLMRFWALAAAPLKRFLARDDRPSKTSAKK
jgi:hypothetical protein